MNVDEAMEVGAAKKNYQHLGLNHSEVACWVLHDEVERLRAELAKLQKDWCDDDEAIKQQALRVLDAKAVEGDSWSVPRGAALAEMMADELVKVRAELAAAKAASVCPVKIHGCFYSVAFDHFGLSSEDSRRFDGWLRDRMNDNPPPAT